MKNVTTIRVRHAAVAAGMGLLLALTACSEPANEDAAATGSEESGAEAAADDGEDTATEESGEAEDEGAEDEGAEDSDEQEQPSGDVVAPAADFDPCTVVSAEQAGDAVGFAVGDGESDELMGSQTCTFTSSEGLAASVLVQWIPVEDDFDTTVASATSAYDDVSEPEDVVVAGTARTVALTGETMGMPAAVVLSQVEGGFFQVVVIGEDGQTDQAVALTELTVSQV
ncbi:hypothetical protein IM660_02355 [Ruania alkalisoli]|uniref:DUF3558 domain-containing protein n=1 Tax=Ruania alkalisoli TaxID=2779775 RepID=A0A7M1SX17_9MICO|nr:hypothetical protein [Ruania alkalisoli]QOR71173.1 hypothetical protein IM660_02355 [Ruania alkalisoli]